MLSSRINFRLSHSFGSISTSTFPLQARDFIKNRVNFHSCTSTFSSIQSQSYLKQLLASQPFKMTEPTPTTFQRPPQTFVRAQMESLMTKRFFYNQAFEIYGGESQKRETQK